MDNEVNHFRPILTATHSDARHPACRYIYIPLGGSKWVILNSVVVFSLVALWHDVSFRLLAWGWLVVLFILPELGSRWLLGGSNLCALYGPFWQMTLLSA
jgi:hypothetical protein